MWRSEDIFFALGGGIDPFTHERGARRVPPVQGRGGIRGPARLPEHPAAHARRRLRQHAHAVLPGQHQRAGPEVRPGRGLAPHRPPRGQLGAHHRRRHGPPDDRGARAARGRRRAARPLVVHLAQLQRRGLLAHRQGPLPRAVPRPDPHRLHRGHRERLHRHPHRGQGRHRHEGRRAHGELRRRHRGARRRPAGWSSPARASSARWPAAATSRSATTRTRPRRPRPSSSAPTASATRSPATSPPSRPTARITLLGRGSVCINTGGEKVYPEEVESALKAHHAVFDAVVVGVPDERWGQRVTAVVAGRATAWTLDLDDLEAHARTELAGYKVPRRAHDRRRGSSARPAASPTTPGPSTWPPRPRPEHAGPPASQDGPRRPGAPPPSPPHPPTHRRRPSNERPAAPLPPGGTRP